jgi:hypothetical protein
MLKGRPLYLAIALLTLCVQVAAAAHSPAVHDEPVSKCHDTGKHFCAETVERESGPCLLCHVSLNGVYLERIDSVATELVTEPAAAVVVPPLALLPTPSAHAPRGPPVG